MQTDDTTQLLFFSIETEIEGLMASINELPLEQQQKEQIQDLVRDYLKLVILPALVDKAPLIRNIRR